MTIPDASANLPVLTGVFSVCLLYMLGVAAMKVMVGVFLL
jgi:hypothetical protein